MIDETSASVLLVACWIAFFAIMGAGHVRLSRHRQAIGAEARKRETSRGSDLGLALQFAGVLVLVLFRRQTGEALSPGRGLAVALLGPAAVLLGWLSVRSLGRHFRIRAVVTEDHELVTGGAYGLVRHPIYLSLLCLVGATAALLASLPVATIGLGIHLAGTEIRVRSEEKLLGRRFGPALDAYRSQVRAYLPYLR